MLYRGSVYVCCGIHLILPCLGHGSVLIHRSGEQAVGSLRKHLPTQGDGSAGGRWGLLKAGAFAFVHLGTLELSATTFP